LLAAEYLLAHNAEFKFCLIQVLNLLLNHRNNLTIQYLKLMLRQ